jgi:hypothetical protein
MSEKQLKEFLETIERVRLANPSPEQKRKFLVDAGFCTESGELTEHYRPVVILAEAQT